MVTYLNHWVLTTLRRLGIHSSIHFYRNKNKSFHLLDEYKPSQGDHLLKPLFNSHSKPK